MVKVPGDSDEAAKPVDVDALSARFEGESPERILGAAAELFPGRVAFSAPKAASSSTSSRATAWG